MSSACVSPFAGNAATPAETVAPPADPANAAASRSIRARAGSASIAGQDEAEVVAAEAAHGVVGANAPAEALRRRPQELVAGGVPVRLVSLRHPVDGDHADGDGVARAHRPRQLTGQDAVERPVPGKPRQRVVACAPGDGLPEARDLDGLRGDARDQPHAGRSGRPPAPARAGIRRCAAR